MLKPGKYIHFKGNEYELLYTAKHSETLEEMVVYKALYGDRDIWVRPGSMWEEEVLHNNKKVKRFSYLNPQQDKIVTSSQMKEIERIADKEGLSYYTMMENAGMGAADFVIKLCKKPHNVAVFCGKGNNGGDGYVIARKLKIEGYNVTVILAEGEPKTKDAIVNKSLVEALKIPILSISIDSEEIENILSKSEIVIDAIYGTGFHGELTDYVKLCAEMINKEKHSRSNDLRIIALDIPSGINGDTGQCDSNAIESDYTLVFHALKPVHLMEAIKAKLGEVKIIDIEIR